MKLEVGQRVMAKGTRLAGVVKRVSKEGRAADVQFDEPGFDGLPISALYLADELAPDVCKTFTSSTQDGEYTVSFCMTHRTCWPIGEGADNCPTLRTR